MTHHTQNGRSMIEMLAVLMIIGLIAIGALAGFGQARLKLRSSQLHDSISYIGDETAKLYAWRRAYPAVNLQQLCENDIFPEGCTDHVPNANPFGGEYCLSSTSDSFTVSASGIPADECTLLTTRDWSYASSVSCSTGSGNCTSSDDLKTLTVTFQ